MSEALQQGSIEGAIEPKTKKKTGSADGKRAKRHKVSKACVFCQRSHMSCDDKRPCQRCIKRNISHMCRDKEPTEGENSDERKGAKTESTPKKVSNDGQKQRPKPKQKLKPKPRPRLEPSAVASDEANAQAAGHEQQNTAPGTDTGGSDSTAPAVTAPSADAGASGSFSAVDMVAGTSSVLSYGQPPYTNGIGNGAGDSVSSLPVAPTPAPAPAPAAAAAAPAPALVSAVSALPRTGGMRFDSNSLLLFGNDVASNEFSALNEFLESLQRGVRGSDRVDSDWLDGDLRLSNPPSSSPSEHPTFPAVGSPVVQPPYANGRTLSLPTVSQLMAGSGGEGVTQTERFLLTAADPNDGTSEDKLRQIINAKYEAGILKPYNYVSGYTRMQQFMEAHVSRGSILRIRDVLSTFRPTFRSIAQALTDIDLLLVEEGFERLLLDYDNVFNSFGVPACLWRRTGEIYKANREFADLVGVPLAYFHEGRVCIYELMSETSTVNYWEKYGEIAFDATQKAVLTTCVLQTAASVRKMVGGGGPGADSNPGADAQQPSAPTRCCFSFTLRRDKYKIPLAIAGNFMPIKQQ